MNPSIYLSIRVLTVIICLFLQVLYVQLVVPDLLLLQDPLLAESVEQLARVDARHRVVDQCVDEVREGHVHSLKQVIRGKQLLLRVQVVYDQLQEVVKT